VLRGGVIKKFVASSSLFPKSGWKVILSSVGKTLEVFKGLDISSSALWSMGGGEEGTFAFRGDSGESVFRSGEEERGDGIIGV
jgi:hypothetical protein